MALSVISVNLPPNIDPTKATLAYGLEAIIRLNRELTDKTLLTRQKALRALCDYLHDHEHIVSALREGIVPSLKTLFKDDDVVCRHLSTECIYVLSNHAIGRDAILSNDIIVPLSLLFEDEENICRKNAHMALELVTETVHGAEGVVAAGLIPKLIEKVKSEFDEIKEYILDSLHFCLRLNTQDALESNGMDVFTELLTHSLYTIRAKAARDIMDLSVPLDGKNKAVEVGTVPSLIDLFTDNSTDVRANAAGALAFIAITTKGKYTAINAGAIPPLLPLVKDANSEVRCNALKLIACLSEAPEGRQMLLEHVDEIKLLEADPVPAVAKHATIAVKVITWKP